MKRRCATIDGVLYCSHDWIGPPHDADWSISDVAVDQTTGQCTGDWVCEHRWPLIRAMVNWRSVAAGAPLRHWWDDGQRQIAFSRASKAFIAINDDQTKSLYAQLQTGLPSGVYCDVATGTVSADSSQCTGRTVAGMARLACFSGKYLPGPEPRLFQSYHSLQPWSITMIPIGG